MNTTVNGQVNMRNNEKILEQIGDTEVFIGLRLIELLRAEAKPETLRAFVECLQIMETAALNLGERRFDNPGAVYAIATEAAAPMQERLNAAIERIEKYLEAQNA
jgi:hypothetical protein